MTSIIIVGYSGHAYVVIATALLLRHTIAGYCDRFRVLSNPYEISYLGSENSYFNSFRSQHFFVAIGDNVTRQRISAKLISRAIPAGALIHPAAVVAENVYISELALICAGASVQPFVDIERGVIVNTGACIDHECTISKFSHIGPNATLTGGVTVGSGALIGAGATVLPGLTIGSGATLGAGAVLTTHLPSGETWVGNPARPLSLVVK